MGGSLVLGILEGFIFKVFFRLIAALVAFCHPLHDFSSSRIADTDPSAVGGVSGDSASAPARTPNSCGLWLCREFFWGQDVFGSDGARHMSGGTLAQLGWFTQV